MVPLAPYRSAGFFDTQQFATAVYQAELTYQLRNLGYQIEAGKSGAPEIKGYSQEYLDASSPRRQQIEEAIARAALAARRPRRSPPTTPATKSKFTRAPR